MRVAWFAALVLVCVCVPPTTVRAHTDDIILHTHLEGAQETPAINTSGTGRFRAVVHPDGTIDFTLTFADLSGPPAVSHIHFAQPDVAGGVMIFLCGGGRKPLCPATTSGTITGTIAATDVVGPAAQGVAPADLVAALHVIIDLGDGYVNMHTAQHPGGEIRGQIKVRE